MGKKDGMVWVVRGGDRFFMSIKVCVSRWICIVWFLEVHLIPSVLEDKMMNITADTVLG